MAEDLEKSRQRYMKALHAMQSGVAFQQSRGLERTSPKHLRVGINARAVDHAALVRLLIARGLFTEAEYVEALADGMEEEVQRHEAEIGPNFKLH